jgi:hypothetical protein
MALSKRDQDTKDFYNKYYSQLAGAVITSAGVVAEDNYGVEFWPTIHVVMKNGQKLVLEVSQDPEGNGPGFLFGLPTGVREQMEVLNSEKDGK